MNESKFFDEITSTGHVWVAMKNSSVVSLTGHNGEVALPIWQSIENAQEYLSNISTINACQPVEVPLEVFKVSWLSEASMGIDELIINPNGLKAKDLVFTKEEFINNVWH